MSEKGKWIIKQFDTLKSNRVNWESHWDEIQKYFIPQKDDIYGIRTVGEEKHNRLYDSTTIHAVELLASALHSMLTNPSLKFFGLSTGDPILDRNESVRDFLQKSTDKIHEVLNNSNFQTQIHEVYMDLISFGTSFILIEDDDERVVRFHAKPIYDIWVRENNLGQIDSFYHRFKWTARKIAKEFGEENLSSKLKACIDKDGEKFEIIHAVFPRNEKFTDMRFGKKSLKRSAFASFHVLMDDCTVLRESGYREFPSAVPRWTKLSDEIYGRSPAMKSLPDARMLQQMMKTTIRGAQKIVDPPLQVIDDGMYRPVRTKPGALNYVRNEKAISPIITGSRIDLGEQMMESVRNRIRSAFFIDQLQLNEGPQMTATEVRQRTEEKLRLLGPVLGRQHNELLRPLIDRVFAIMLRKGELPTPPDVLRQTDGQLDVNYISAIARVQKSSESQNIIRSIGDIAPLIESDPSILDNVNGDKAFRYVADLHGVPQSIFRKEDEVDEIREARSQAQQQEAQAEQQLQQAQTMKQLAG